MIVAKPAERLEDGYMLTCFSAKASLSFHRPAAVKLNCLSCGGKQLLCVLRVIINTNR